jgi:hypothetical protein
MDNEIQKSLHRCVINNANVVLKTSIMSTPFFVDPAPSYISLSTALYYHGMIDQIPSTIHAMTTARTKTFKCIDATFSFHLIAPSFFCGFENFKNSQVMIATPEKALVDYFYMHPSRDRKFRNLPEVHLSKKFKKSKAIDFVKLIHSKQQRSLVETRLQKVFNKKSDEF